MSKKKNKKRRSKQHRNRPHGRVWHYTHMRSLWGILKDGAIQPMGDHELKPVHAYAVWASENPRYEITAAFFVGIGPDGRAVFLTFEEMHEQFGVARIELPREVLPHSWADYVRLVHMPALLAKAMEASGKRRGSRYQDWRATFDVVPASQWLAVQIWTGKAWIDLAASPKPEHQDMALLLPDHLLLTEKNIGNRKEIEHVLKKT